MSNAKPQRTQVETRDCHVKLPQLQLCHCADSTTALRDTDTVCGNRPRAAVTCQRLSCNVARKLYVLRHISNSSWLQPLVRVLTTEEHMLERLHKPLYNSFIGKPHEKRPFGVTACRDSKDNIKIDLQAMILHWTGTISRCFLVYFTQTASSRDLIVN
jgi:hypothetical protein